MDVGRNRCVRKRVGRRLFWAEAQPTCDPCAETFSPMCQPERRKIGWCVRCTCALCRVEERGGGSLSAQISGGMGRRPSTTVGIRKLVPWLSCGIVCIILCLAVLRQCWRGTDGWMDRQMTRANIRTSIASLR